jgi:hypothetical protein
MHLRCAQSRMPVYWYIILMIGIKNITAIQVTTHGPKTFPITWLTGNQIINFSHKNSPDQAEGYLDYLQPLISYSDRSRCVVVQVQMQLQLTVSDYTSTRTALGEREHQLRVLLLSLSLSNSRIA